MFKKIFIFVFIIFIMNSCTKNVKKENNLKQEKIVANEMQGSDKIQNIELRQTVNKFFNDKITLKDEFRYLSKNYLNKFYPNIDTSEEYVSYVKKVTEEYIETKYLEIIDVKKENDDKYVVYIIIQSQDSADDTEMSKEKIKYGYIFVKEERIWKYDGKERGSFEVIK